jgi:hypothetical protein
MKESKLIYLDPSELTIHPAAKKLPSMAKDDERFIWLIDSIRERGINQPLQADSEHRVLDGRERLKAAKQLQLKAVPVIIRDGDSATLILDAILHRKHYTKGALAYLAFPLFASALEESKKRRLENLKNAENAPFSRSSPSGLSAEDIAEKCGVGRSLFFQAGQLHKLFRESDKAIEEWEMANPHGGEGRPDDLRARFEPEILMQPVGGEKRHIRGLGDIIAGIAGMNSTKGQPLQKPLQLDLFEDAWHDLKTRAGYWERFDERTKFEARQVIYKTVREMPDEVVEVLMKAIKARREEKP